VRSSNPSVSALENTRTRKLTSTKKKKLALALTLNHQKRTREYRTAFAESKHIDVDISAMKKDIMEVRCASRSWRNLRTS